MGPYTVLRKIGSNTYVMDLPDDMWINLVFNITDLLPYHMPLVNAPIDNFPSDSSSEENSSDPGRVDTAQSLVPNKVSNEIIASEEVPGHHSRDGGHGLTVKLST